MAYNEDGTKYRAFVWFMNTDIDNEDFTGVHDLTLDGCRQKVEEFQDQLRGWGYTPTKVEYQLLTDWGMEAQDLFVEVA